MLMDWGIQQADQKSLETYIDATNIGRPLYAKYGFLEGPKIEFALDSLEETPRRKELEKELLPFEWWPMFRPVGGKYEDGQALLPWEKE
jgi:hypothetical protein